MNNDEKKGYARGYAAGRKRVEHEMSAEDVRRERQEFHDKAFLAVLPAAVRAQGWTRGGKPITSVPDRVQLAREIADEALKARRYV